MSVLIVPKEMYPYPPDIPEGRWAVYEVTLPNRPYFPVTVTYHTITDTIALSHPLMTFEPDGWNIPQDLTVYALEDSLNMRSPYAAAFNLSLSSTDKNFNGPLPDFNVTVEDNDEGTCIVVQRGGGSSSRSCGVADSGTYLRGGGSSCGVADSGTYLVMYICTYRACVSLRVWS